MDALALAKEAGNMKAVNTVLIGALAAGIIVGLVEAMTSFVLPSSMKSIGIYLLYLGVVFFRPSGLFGRL